MSANVTHFLLREFGAIRIECQHQGCRAITELDLARVESALQKTKACCPVCDKPFTDPTVANNADMVTQLAKTLLAIDKLGDSVQVRLPWTEASANV